jgi:hypothetical protein
VHDQRVDPEPGLHVEDRRQRARHEVGPQVGLHAGGGARRGAPHDRPVGRDPAEAHERAVARGHRQPVDALAKHEAGDVRVGVLPRPEARRTDVPPAPLGGPPALEVEADAHALGPRHGRHRPDERPHPLDRQRARQAGIDLGGERRRLRRGRVRAGRRRCESDEGEEQQRATHALL